MLGGYIGTTEDLMAVKRYKGKKSLKKPDEFITFSSKLLKQVVLHKTKIISVLSGIVVVIVVVSTVNYFSKKAEDRSLVLLNQAMTRYESIQKEGDPVKAYDAVKGSLTELTKTYENKTGGKLANFFLAESSYAAGEYDQAVTLYKKAVTDFKGVFPMESLAKSSLGYSLEQQGDHEAAAAIFSSMPTDPDSIMGDEMLFALGRQYAALGKTGLQKEISKKLIETYPQSIYANVVKEKFPGLEQPAS